MKILTAIVGKFEDDNGAFDLAVMGMTLTETVQALSLQEFLDDSFHQTPAIIVWEGEKRQKSRKFLYAIGAETTTTTTIFIRRV